MERTLLYSDRTKRNFAVNVPEINTKTKEKNEANRQYEEHLNNYHASFENSPICLFKKAYINTTRGREIHKLTNLLKVKVNKYTEYVMQIDRICGSNHRDESDKSGEMMFACATSQFT